jgi:hypothetical protein
LSRIIQRSRYFIANAAKSDLPNETAGQTELGFRFFEGAAAGAVLLGHPPSGLAFDRFFAWDDSIVPVPWASDALPRIIAELDREPQRLQRIRAQNIAACLSQHDWVWRWRAILDAAGLSMTNAMQQRLQTLQHRYYEIAPEPHQRTTLHNLNPMPATRVSTASNPSS